jgi:PAS domain S-box-containing protein
MDEVGILAPVYDDEANIVAGRGVTEDVTQTRAAELALRESEERSRLGFVHAPIGQALVELDGRWRAVNAAVTRFTGYTEAELLRMTYQDITHPDDLDVDHEQLEQLLAGDIDSYQCEKRYIHATGAAVSVLLAVSLVRHGSDDRPLYFITQIQDVTEFKRQREALENLVAMLAHDLRTLLTCIVGFADLLVSDWDDYTEGDRVDMVQRISRSGHVMERLVENTLTVSTLAAKSVEARPTSVRVDHAVREVLDLLTYSADGLVLELLPLTMWADPSHLSQIVTNLLSNAFKYGGAQVTVACEELPRTVELRISDRGPGVPAEFVPHLFDRYTRSRTAQTGDQQGSGFGLYIVQQLVTANKGEVTYTQTPGGGATFTLSLPRPRSTRAVSPYRRDDG